MTIPLTHTTTLLAMMMDGMMRGMVGWMWLIPLLIVIVVVVAVVLVVRSAGRDRGGNAEPSAREVLDRRYAEGHLTREEYLQRRDDLDG